MECPAQGTSSARSPHPRARLSRRGGYCSRARPSILRLSTYTQVGGTKLFVSLRAFGREMRSFRGSGMPEKDQVSEFQKQRIQKAVADIRSDYVVRFLARFTGRRTVVQYPRRERRDSRSLHVATAWYDRHGNFERLLRRPRLRQVEMLIESYRRSLSVFWAALNWTKWITGSFWFLQGIREIITALMANTVCDNGSSELNKRLRP